MAREWLKNLLETKEEKEKKVIEEFTQSDEFKELVKDTASELVKQTKEAEEAARIEAEEEEKRKLKESIEHIERVGDSMKDSPEPFINVLGMGFSKENGLSVKLDYNEAFIRYLNKAGINAANDEETIRLWLAHLNYDIEQEMLAEDYLRNGVSEDEAPPMSFDDYFPQDEDEDDEDEPNSGWK